jgi:hypothetical protein
VSFVLLSLRSVRQSDSFSIVFSHGDMMVPIVLTSHFHIAKKVSCRHLLRGIRRPAQLSRYAKGSFASDMASREAVAGAESGDLLVGAGRYGNIDRT